MLLNLPSIPAIFRLLSQQFAFYPKNVHSITRICLLSQQSDSIPTICLLSQQFVFYPNNLPSIPTICLLYQQFPFYPNNLPSIPTICLLSQQFPFYPNNSPSIPTVCRILSQQFAFYPNNFLEDPRKTAKAPFQIADFLWTSRRIGTLDHVLRLVHYLSYYYRAMISPNNSHQSPLRLLYIPAGSVALAALSICRELGSTPYNFMYCCSS
jgi:hypothetical protein